MLRKIQIDACKSDARVRCNNSMPRAMQRTLATKCESRANKAFAYIVEATCTVVVAKSNVCESVCAQFSGVAHKNVFQLFCKIASLIMEMINRQVQ